MKRLIVLVCLLCGCDPVPAKVQSDSGLEYTVRKIDGCEYIEFSWMRGTDAGMYSLTHKGNCSNPIHVYQTEQPPTGDKR